MQKRTLIIAAIVAVGFMVGSVQTIAGCGSCGPDAEKKPHVHKKAATHTHVKKDGTKVTCDSPKCAAAAKVGCGKTGCAATKGGCDKPGCAAKKGGCDKAGCGAKKPAGDKKASCPAGCTKACCAA